MPMTEARWLQSEQTEVMMQVYPEKVAALPPQQLQTLLHTLEFGIAAPEPEAVQSALEALAALARFDYQSKQSGQAGLQAGPGTPPAPLKHHGGTVKVKLVLNRGHATPERCLEQNMLSLPCVCLSQQVSVLLQLTTVK